MYSHIFTRSLVFGTKAKPQPNELISNPQIALIKIGLISLWISEAAMRGLKHSYWAIWFTERFIHSIIFLVILRYVAVVSGIHQSANQKHGLIRDF